MKEEPKQETTLEEVADKANGYGVYGKGLPKYCAFNEGFIEGAKLAERMYSEEDIHKIVESYQNTMENNPTYITYNQWFEQFKKK